MAVTAAQVGEYFIEQYYQMLQQQPEFVFQQYSDASTVVRVDGSDRQTATTMLEIHNLMIALNYSVIEIKTAHSLESWNGGVLVMVSGCVHLKDFNEKRKFVQTFFLAPQETGYFILSDIFHFIEEDQILQLPATYLAPNNPDPKLIASTVMQDQVPGYMIGGDFGAGDFEVPANVEENGLIDNYSFLEQRLHHVPETAHIHEDCFAVWSNGSVHSTVTLVNEHPITPVEEPAGEPQKHTYASIVAKGKSAPAVPTQFSLRKTISRASEQHRVPDSSSQRSFSKPVIAESFRDGTVEDFSAVEDKVKIQSVYVKNVPSTASASEIAKEFRKFGKLRPNGVAIRTRKDVNVHYAFVEFEDITGVQNAIKASTVLISGQQVYIEGRRANRVNEPRGGSMHFIHFSKGRGKSKGGYHVDASKGRCGACKFTKGGDQDGKHNRLRGNGYYQPTTQQERVGLSSRQSSRNGSTNLSD